MVADIDRRLGVVSGNMVPALTEMLDEFFMQSQVGGVQSEAELQRRTKSLLYSEAAREFSPAEILAIETVDISDITHGLHDLQRQVQRRRSRDARYPVVLFDDHQLPLLEPTWSASAHVWRPEGLSFQPLRMSTISLGDMGRVVAVPFSHVLTFRLFPSSLGAPNVEVTNITKNWQVIYTGIITARKIGFGGPTNGPAPPVKGYLANGIWKFGISDSTQDKWDSTPWKIPPTLTATPPYQIYLPL